MAIGDAACDEDQFILRPARDRRPDGDGDEAGTGVESICKLYSAGRLTRFSPLPLLTDSKVRSAPVLENHPIRLGRASFQTDSARI
ncbi:hypothetical protein EN859_000520 [Mesorhizobium sp. M00.F.Ca.ET.216.01.1.1]|nr:hypothetical protein EN859_000520 [Mesorhizobium sp. M00.F.Ca.ET.216.01.1.1]TIS58725.1 MAG: hypothetical protein E5W91_06990 [Mesorhizobium sp.]TIS92260.1 MAG: hypothetical protein E5W89_05290 [Mesorhizobium sp.]TJW18030.1 MAG: hypothetical protein E5W82_03375 [Mesorhizobium sp.]TJW47234.1 MAG: hypothetical protein E5W83_06475 [Mesorhizobium sp.]